MKMDSGRNRRDTSKRTSDRRERPQGRDDDKPGTRSTGRPSAGRPSAGRPSAGRPSAARPSAGRPTPTKAATNKATSGRGGSTRAGGGRAGSKEANELRLNKFIADAGYCSRRKADELIDQGFVKVNGKTVVELGTKVKRSDFITVKGDPIAIEMNEIYIILNKPKDYITTTSDDQGRKTVMDIVRKRARIFPIGRLDRNTTGILLMTNDGELAHRLTHPSYTIERIYYVKLDKALAVVHAEQIAKGVELDDGVTAPCRVDIDPDDRTKVIITLTEGKNREVRRIFEYFDYDVRQLDRRMFAGLSHSGLKRGEYRHLDKKELAYLKKLVKMR